MRLFILLLLVTVSQACTPPPPKASINMEQEIFLSRHWNLAVLDLDYTPIEGTHQAGVVSAVSGASDAGRIIASLLANELGRLNNISIVERGQIDDLLDEQKLQMSGIINTGSAVEIGKILGADAVVIGSVSDYANWTAVLVPGSTVSFSMRMIDVETGKVITSGSITKVKEFSVAFENAQELTRQLVAQISQQ